MVDIDPKKEGEKNSDITSKVELLTTGKFSDFTICCDNHDFKVHRAVLYGKSQFLDALIDGAFKESDQLKAFSPDEPAVQAVVLYWIYTGQYALLSTIAQQQQEPTSLSRQSIRQQHLLDLTPKAPVLPVDSLTSHLKVYEAADRQMLPKLADVAKQSFQDLLTSQSIDHLQSSQDFAAALTLIYQDSLALEGIRPFVAWTVASKTHITHGNGEEWKKLSVIGKKIPGFVWDLLVEHTRNAKIWECASCCLQRPFNDVFSTSALIVRTKTVAQWIPCNCELRGFCSRLCEAVDSKSHPSFYCSPCRRSHNGWGRFGSMEFGSSGKIEKCAPFEAFADKSNKIVNLRAKA